MEPRAPNFPSWGPEALHFLDRSPGTLNPFGRPEAYWVEAGSWLKSLFQPDKWVQILFLPAS